MKMARNPAHGPLARYVKLWVALAPGKRFPHHRGLAIPTCTTARAWRTCRDACRDRYLAVSFEFGGGENVLGIPGPGACAKQNFPYLVRGPWTSTSTTQIGFTQNGTWPFWPSVQLIFHESWHLCGDPDYQYIVARWLNKASWILVNIA